MNTIDKSAFAAAASAAVVAFSVASAVQRISYVPPGAKHLPPPPGWYGFLFGYLPNPAEEPGEDFQRNCDLFEDEHPALHFRLATEPRVQLLRPCDIHYVCNNTAVFPKPWMYEAILGPILGQGLVTILDEAFHTQQRKAVSPAFGYTALTAIANNIFSRLVHEAFTDASVRSHEVGEEGGGISATRDGFFPVQMARLYDQVTLKAVEETAFRPDSVSKPHKGRTLHDHTSSLLGTIRPRWWYFLPFGTKIPTFGKWKISAGRQQLASRIRELATQCEQSPTPKKEWVLFDYLVHEPSLPPELLLDHSLTFLFAGYETTATSMSWLTYALAAHPEVQAKLFEELSGSMTLDSIPSVEALRECAYLDAVINESLRLYPTVLWTARCVSEDTVLPSGVCLNKGNTVILAPMLLHRSRRIWGSDARSYKPERWLEELTQEQRDAFMPFLVGKRNCIGKDFALNEMRMLTAALVRRYELRWPEGTPTPRRQLGPTSRPGGKLSVLLRRREA